MLTEGLQRAVTDSLVVCPCCTENLQAQGKSLRCAKGHCFDVARQGYVNLAPGKKPPEAYDRKLWEARAHIIGRGFFAPLLKWSANILPSLPRGYLLDAGCGEGSFLITLSAENPDTRVVGVDLAAEGVRMAAGRSKTGAWLVADLAALPLADASCSAVFNILSPANYGEFFRVLQPGGLLIKAVPTTKHLREIREALGFTEDFSNAKVVDHFRSFFAGAQSQIVEGHVLCGRENANHFLAMTPLAWHATPAQRAAFANNPPEKVSVSFEILWAQK